MAYVGTTAASSIANPPLSVIQTLSAGGFSTSISTGINMGATFGSSVGAIPGRALGGNIWYYATTDATTAVCAQGYFTDGLKLGMRPGDLLAIVTASSLGGANYLGWGVIGDVTSTGVSVGVAGSSKSVMLSSLS